MNVPSTPPMRIRTPPALLPPMRTAWLPLKELKSSPLSSISSKLGLMTQSSGSEGSLSEATTQDTSTSRSSWLSEESSHSKESFDSLERKSMRNLVDPKQLRTMYGKRTREPAIHLNMESNQSTSRIQQIGIKSFGSNIRYGNLPSKEDCLKSHQVFVYVLIAPLSRLKQIISDLVKLRSKYSCSGESLVLESPAVLGQKLDWMLTLKILAPSFGMCTQVNEMLYWMNFEAVLTSPISCDGLTGIRSEWKSKGALLPYAQNQFGLLLTCLTPNGTQDWMMTPSKLLGDDLP